MEPARSSRRPDDPDATGPPRWALKRRFELELGGAGGDGRAATYAAKLTDGSRERYLRLGGPVRRHPASVAVAE